MKEILNFIPVFNVSYAVVVTDINVELRKVEAMASVKEILPDGVYKMSLKPMCLDIDGNLEMLDADYVGYKGIAKTEIASIALSGSSLPVILI
jgi:hypothetical protein